MKMKKRKHKKAHMRRDAGLVQVPIKNTHGRPLGVLQFHPGPETAERCRQCAGVVKETVTPLIGVSISPDGTPAAGSTVEEIATLEQTEQRFLELFDYMIGAGASKAFFKETRPFAAVGGEFYCTKVLDALNTYLFAHSPA